MTLTLSLFSPSFSDPDENILISCATAGLFSRKQKFGETATPKAGRIEARARPENQKTPVEKPASQLVHVYPLGKGDVGAVDGLGVQVGGP